MRLILTLSLLLIMGMTAQAQDFPELDKSPLDVAYFPNRVTFRNFAKTEAEKNAEPIMRVLYSRPQKKGRDVFGGLEEFGSVWRVGANEATEIEFFRDVNVGDTRVKAGRYTLYCLLGESEWEVYLNTDLDVWGAYAYNDKHNVASIKVPVQETDATVEAFTVVFKEVDGGAHLIMAWDDTMVEVPVMW